MEIDKMIYFKPRLSKEQQTFIDFYKKDKMEACAYMRAMTPGGKITHTYPCMIEKDTSLLIMLKRSRVGVSKTNRIFVTDSVVSAIIISKKGKGIFFKDSKGGFKRVSLATRGWNALFGIPDAFQTYIIEKWFNAFGSQFYFLKEYVVDGKVWNHKFPFSMLRKAGVRNLRGYFRYMFPNIPWKWLMGQLDNPKYTMKHDYGKKRFFDLNKELDIVQGLTEDNIDECLKRPLFQDLCRMSAAIQAPVNANWSDRRMTEEHDKVNKKLTSIIAKYDDRKLKIDMKYLPEVPESWELITNNGRLVYEGTIMRHCVGTYGASVDSGRSLIYSTLFNGERWTIQVTKELKGGVWHFKISQAKGFANKNAPDEILKYELKPIEVAKEDMDSTIALQNGAIESIGHIFHNQWENVDQWANVQEFRG